MQVNPHWGKVVSCHLLASRIQPFGPCLAIETFCTLLVTDQCGGQWERGCWCSRLTARHGNSCQWQFLKCQGHMLRLQRHVTHALSTPCFIYVHVPWALFANCWWKWMCCECAYLTCILIYTGQKLLRLSSWLHTFCYGEYGSGSRLLISNTNTVCR